MAQDPELPYLNKPGPKADITRNPSESSHHASADRTAMLKRLGVQEGGFFANWGQRYKRPGYQDQQGYSPEVTDTNLQMPDLEQFGQQAIKEVKPSKLPQGGIQMPQMEQQQQPGSATGRTKQALRNTEMGMVASQLRGKIADNPFLSTSVLDTMTATSINMDRQVLMDMYANPSKMLGQATLDYYLNSIKPATTQTNFEAMTSAYSDTKKKAAKNINYAGAEMGKMVAKLKKNPTYSGNMINIGSMSGYSPTYYSPPL